MAEPITDIRIVSRQPRWPVGLDAGGRNRARKTVNKPTKPAVEEPGAAEQPKVVTSDDLGTWIDLKPALPMSELFTALWDHCTAQSGSMCKS